jgi:hypothetical protein
MFLPLQSSGDIVHIEKSGRFDVDVVLKSHKILIYSAILKPIWTYIVSSEENLQHF